MSKQTDDINALGIRLGRTTDDLRKDVLTQNNLLFRTQCKLELATMLLKRTKLVVDTATTLHEVPRDLQVEIAKLQYDVDEFLFG